MGFAVLQHISGSAQKWIAARKIPEARRKRESAEDRRVRARSGIVPRLGSQRAWFQSVGREPGSDGGRG